MDNDEITVEALELRNWFRYDVGTISYFERQTSDFMIRIRLGGYLSTRILLIMGNSLLRLEHIRTLTELDAFCALVFGYREVENG